jgi:hypothetical protein
MVLVSARRKLILRTDSENFKLSGADFVGFLWDFIPA